MEYPDIKAKKLYEVVMYTFRSEALKTKNNRTFWNLVFKYAVDMVNFPNHDGGTTRYSCKKELRM